MATPKDFAREAQASITENVRDIWLAGLGLFSTVEEEGEKLFKQFIEKGRGLEEKGETFEKKAKDQLDSVTHFVTEKAGKITDEVSTRVTDMMPTFVEEKFHNALEVFGISTRSEVKELNEKVNKLTEMVGTLSDKIGKTAKPVAPTVTKA